MARTWTVATHDKDINTYNTYFCELCPLIVDVFQVPVTLSNGSE
jgi:hypothetical protein